MTESTDEQLLREAQRGRAAQQVLLDAVWPRAYRVALGVLRDPAAAEDVAQETCLKLLDGAQGYDTARPLRPWYLRVARNAALDRQRAQQRRSTHERRAARGESIASGVDADVLALREQLTHLDDAVRESLALHYTEGLTQLEAAAVLDCPAGTVASRIRRGLGQLREALTPALAGSLASLLPAALATPIPASPSLESLELAGAGDSLASSTPAKARGPGAVGRGAPPALALLTGLAVVGVVGLGLASALLEPESPAAPSTPAVARADDTARVGTSTDAELGDGAATRDPADGGSGDATVDAAAGAANADGVSARQAGLDLRATLNGEPWPGAEVELRRFEPLQPGESAFLIDFDGPTLETRSVFTDAVGAVELSLAPGVWQLRVRAPHAPVPLPTLALEGLADYEQTVELSVVVSAHYDEDWEQDVDLLVRPGQRVQVAADLDDVRIVRGRVVDSDGQGMPAAWVWTTVSVLSTERPLAPPLYAFRCDADGAFSFPTDELAGSQLRLGARAPGHAPAGCRILVGAEPVTIGLTAGRSARVRVADPDGRPLPLATLTVSATVPDALSGEPIEWSQTEEVGPDGLEVRLPFNCGPGFLYLEAEATDTEGNYATGAAVFAPARAWPPVRTLDAEGRLAPGHPGADPGRPELVVTFRAPVTVGGTVVGPDGRAVPGARLLLSNAGPVRAGALQELESRVGTTAVSDGDGRFEVAGVRGQRARLYVLADGLALACVRLERASREPLRIELAEPRTLDVRIRWADTKIPATVVSVVAYQPEHAPKLGQTVPMLQAAFPDELALAMADEAGRARLEGLPAAPVVCVVVVGQRAVHVERLGPEDTELEIQLGSPPALATVEAIDPQTGDVLQVGFQAYDASGGEIPTVNYSPFAADASGAFVHGSGRARLVLILPDRPPLERWVELDDAALGRVEIPRGVGTIRARLTYPRGEPITGVILTSADPVSGLPIRRWFEGGDGTQPRELTGLTPGEYRFELQLVAAGLPVKIKQPTLEVTVPDGVVEVELDLRLR